MPLTQGATGSNEHREDNGVTMTQQAITGQASLSGGIARGSATPEIMVRLTGALLALAVAGVHVADQGGVTVLNSPAWIGWGYRTIEVGGVLTALILLLPWPAWREPAWFGWAASALLGAGPFVAYIASRTVGLPGDPGDVGNWGYWVGTVSLFIEAALMVLSVSMLLAQWQRPSRAR
jgi:hypothetical protein